ncbi:MAG TPA: peptidylprolyl isomerase [Pyrinomonadaceae bacterium]|nr:peptidylprolyl isomerase [Pyrinomonadaceae bacterium]
MQTANFRKTLYAGLLIVVSMTTAAGQKIARADSASTISTKTMLRILRAEDERRWDQNVSLLLSAAYPITRKRVALALGRIGDERALPQLIEGLNVDSDNDVRQMCAFAIGEIESPAGVDALIAILDDTAQPGEVRARAVEALGKIGAVLLSNSAASGSQTALPKVEDKTLTKIRLAILDALRFESGRRAAPDRATILLGLTAALRVRPDAVGPIIVKFLGHSDPRIVADTLNTMARLRLKDNNDQVRQLLNNGDVIVRANAARVIGAADDKGAFDALLSRALNDDDLRVRASAIRALGSLKDVRAVEPLVQRGNSLLASRSASASQNELLEITATLGRLLPNTSNEKAVAFVRQMHKLTKGEAVEVETAFARMAPGIFQNDPYRAEDTRPNTNWRQVSRRAQGLAAIRDVITGAATGSAGDTALKDAQMELAVMLRRSGTPALAVPDILQAYSSFKATDTSAVALSRLRDSDVIVRATAAEVLGEQTPDEANARALIAALPVALRDKDLNDAALAILDALAKQKSAIANEAIKTALDSPDHLIRRKAVALLKANGVGDFSSRIGTVRTRNTEADYLRSINRSGRKVTATLMTSKGAFTIEFLPEAAPLTVDNFIQLARKGYFNGQTIPRVVPNFVVQAGDPRGDQNGGPGYQIRCEINEVPFDRAAVGMALSGKDTGGSQWFVTHSPQPHLDGGYTVFGRVIRGLEVVDNIVRGDTIRWVIVNER